MASTGAQPLEREFSEIPGLVQMTSKSALGSARITLQFSLDRDIDAASLDVQAAISDAAGKLPRAMPNPPSFRKINPADSRSEEHTSELQSLMRISYAVFCLKKKKNQHTAHIYYKSRAHNKTTYKEMKL